MAWMHRSITVLTVAFVPSLLWAAEDANDANAPAAIPVAQETSAPEASNSGPAENLMLDPVRFGPAAPSSQSDLVARFGWWGVGRNGSTTKTGEYQDLHSSPFWDLDGLFTNGERTVDFSATGLDNEGTDARLNYFGRETTAKFEFQRFLRRLDHDPLDNFLGVVPGQQATLVSQDLNVGDDYAIRVDQLKGSVKGYLTENLKYRVRVWGMRKFGERQANAIAHCFQAGAADPPVVGVSPNTRICHLQSQRQRIDWLTEEVEPAVIGTFGPVNIEYSRLMRAFYQDDQVVTRTYTGIAPTIIQGEFPYASVPENITQMDKVKLGVDLPFDSHLYTFVLRGDTHNRIRNVDRNFYGMDIRLTNEAIDGVTLAAYAKTFNEDNQLPTSFLPEEDPAEARHPINYARTRFGLKTRWQPVRTGYWRGLAVTGGYEYLLMDRDFANFSSPDRMITYSQDHTFYHTFNLGTRMHWSWAVESFARYRKRFADAPLFGVRETNGLINSNLPDDTDVFEVGGTWSPSTNLLLSGTIGMEFRSNVSSAADFDEHDYPATLTMWYAPTPKLSLSAGYAYYSNWIDQNITLGDDVGGLIDPNNPDYNPAELTPTTSRWNYGGRSSIVTCGCSYAVNERVTFSAGGQWGWSRANFDPIAGFEDLSDFSDETIETVRLHSGVDVKVRERVTVYCRYVYFDYEDYERELNSGDTNMLLTGLSAAY